MKILAVSLLRLGDLIQHHELVEGLRRRFPAATVDLLVDSSSNGARDLFSPRAWHFFDRGVLQRKVGMAEENIFAPARDVVHFAERLSAENYDLIVNFSHTRLSAHLCDLIQAPRKSGLVSHGGIFGRLDNDWMRYLNNEFASQPGGLLHYIETLAGGFGLNVAPVKAERRDGPVVFQPFTSDIKKNWSLARFRELYRLVSAQKQVHVLGACADEPALRAAFPAASLFIENLASVRDLLSQASLIVTGDTSIKHLAVNVGAPIVEIALGSSDPWKTGAYQDGAIILRGNTPCAPCPQRAPCGHNYACAAPLSVDMVFEAAQVQLEGGEEELFHPAQGLLFRTQSHAQAGWILADQAFSPAQIEELVLNKMNLKRKLNEGGNDGQQYRKLPVGGAPTA